MKRASQWLRGLMHLSIALVFFFGAFWLRPDYPDSFPPLPYFAGFVIAIPVMIALICWLLLGLPGLFDALGDHRRWFLMALGAFTFWVLISPGWSRFEEVSQGAAQQWIFTAFFITAVIAFPPPARRITLALAFGLLLQSLIAIAQFGAQRSIGLYVLGEFHLWPERAGISVVVSGFERLIRPYGLSPHPNIVAGYIAIALIAITGWLSDRNLAAWRWIVRLSIALIGIWALCLTFSRGAWGGAVGGLILVGGAILIRRVTIRPSIRALVFVAGAILTVIGMFAARYPHLLAARTGAGSEVVELRSVADRRVFIEIAVQLIRAHPIGGVGVGASDWEAAQILINSPYRELTAEKVHNIFLLVLSETGIVGLGFYVAMILTAGVAVWRKARDLYAIGLAAASVALLAIGMLDHYPWSIFHFGLILWSGFAIAMTPPTPQADRPAPDSPAG